MFSRREGVGLESREVGTIMAMIALNFHPCRLNLEPLVAAMRRGEMPTSALLREVVTPEERDAVIAVFRRAGALRRGFPRDP